MTKTPLLLTAALAPLALAACASVSSQPDIVSTATPTEAAVQVASLPDRKAQLGAYGYDAAGMDAAVQPGDDFYDYANGTWAKTTAIPADKSNYGMFTVLSDLSQERVRGILDEAKADPNSAIGRAYASYLDEAGVEAKGLAPIQPWLTEIKGLKNRADYPALIAKADRMGVRGPVGSYVGQDDKNPDVYILSVGQSGLGLPDRDYYLSDDAKMKTIRTAYRDHLAKQLTNAGETNAQARADAILAYETKIAQVSWTREDSSDATKTYNRRTLAELQKSTPGFDFARYFEGIGASDPDAVIVSQPSAVTGIAKLVSQAPLSVLQDQLIVRSMDGFASVLPKAVKDEQFAFYGTTLSGTPEQEVRWKQAVGFTEGALGEEVGKIYAAKYFPPEYKAKMNQLVDNIKAAFGRRIEGLDWMEPATKKAAQAKLANFTVKVGYPDRFRDYDGLEIKSDDLFGNAVRSNEFDHAYNLGKLGEPIRRWEWGMLPETVNAYANFGMTEIVFPAAILQPPFFDPNADDAVNYGGIGAVIGHEMSHHFDDQGSKYDANGRLSDWWTPTDVKNFEGLTKKLVAQYDQYEPFPGLKVKGEYTLGENIGDLAGLTVAYDAYQATLDGKPAPTIDGTTGDQRFYLGWAQVWRRNVREAAARQRVLTDPHSPAQYRADIVRNMDPWYAAFPVQAGQTLYLAPAERVKIW